MLFATWRGRVRRGGLRPAALLIGRADDVVAICRELDLPDIVFVGHSVSAMIDVLAARQGPELFDTLVLGGPSPRYIDEVVGNVASKFSTAR